MFHGRSGTTRRYFLAGAASSLALGPTAIWAAENRVTPISWIAAWPRTDFLKSEVPLDLFTFPGTPRDRIEALDRPSLANIYSVASRLHSHEPVLSVEIFSQARAYPLRYLIWHEAINDVVSGVPILVTYCPRTDTALVHDRRVGKHVLRFGVTGMLRDANLILYDRRTESWWQQYEGRSVVGRLSGAKLRPLPARVESIASFADQYGARQTTRVMVARRGERSYGLSLYPSYDSRPWPFIQIGSYAEDIPPLERIVAVENHGWPLRAIQARGRINWRDFVISWTPGRASALDTEQIEDGRDLGNVYVQRHPRHGGPYDIPYRLSFAFAFRAFQPEGILHRD